MDTAELIGRCIRILKISTKPSDQEFEQVAKVTGIGIVAIGLLAVVISFLFTLIDSL